MPWLEASDLPTCRAWAELEVLATRAWKFRSSVRDRQLICGADSKRDLGVLAAQSCVSHSNHPESSEHFRSDLKD